MNPIVTWVLIVGINLLAMTDMAADPTELFTKQSLSFDVAAVPFETTNRTGFGGSAAPISPIPLQDANTIWMTNSVSGAYHHNFPVRFLRFGFRDGRLAAVRISINSFDGLNTVDESATAPPDTVEKIRKELRQIQGQFNRLISNPQYKSSRFRVQCGVMCGPQAESLFLMELEVTPGPPFSATKSRS